MKLPKQLQRAVSTVSATVQQLIYEVALWAQGLPAEANRKARTEYEDAAANQRPTEQLAQRLDAFLRFQATLTRREGQLNPTDCAIAAAASSGRNTREIADFMGFEQTYVRNRLHKVHERAREWAAQQPNEEPEPGETSDVSEVLDIFAEAQGRVG